MAAKDSTPTERRRKLMAELVRDAEEIDVLLRELLEFLVKLQRTCQTSRRLGNRLYRVMREAQKRAVARA